MRTEHILKLHTPVIAWKDNIPVSEDYGDIFYSTKDGPLESKHVFLDGCGLPQKWQNKDYFCIGEVGFGSGLNFFVTLELWEKTRNKSQVLWYIAVEKHPWSVKQMERSASNFPHLEIYAKEIYNKLPPSLPGFYLVHLEKRNTFLLLLQGEASEQLSRLNAQVDAWFLDGFKPSAEESCWDASLFSEVNKRSHSETTLATFSCARSVKEMLHHYKIPFQKRKGCLGKRECLSAKFSNSPERKPIEKIDEVIVLGDGFAGSAVANAAKRRGIKSVQIYKKSFERAASDVPAAMLHPKITEKHGGLSQLSAQGYSYLKNWLIENLKEEAYQLNGIETVDFQGHKGEKEGGFLFTKPFKEALQREILIKKEGFNGSKGKSVTIDAVGASGVDSQWINFGSVLLISLKKERFISRAVYDNGYLIPLDKKTVLVGSTYSREWENKEITKKMLIEKFRRMMPLSPETAIERSELWQGKRVNKPGRFPLCFNKEGKGVLNALGSHGVVRSMIMAEHLISLITGQPDPIPKDISRHFRQEVG